MGSPKTAGVPVLETERTIMRAHRIDDFDDYAVMWASPVTPRFINGKPRTREESWMRFLRHAGLWSLLGYGFWAVEDKASGRFIGEAGFHDMRREITPSIEGTLEAGWGLTPAVHGRGYGFEAMQALVDWADAAFPGRRMTCIIDPANQASQRVAAKLGFREIVRTTYHGGDTILFERMV